MGYKLIAIGGDAPAGLRATVNKHSLEYDVYSDASSEAAKAMGLAWQMPDEMVAKYLAWEIDIEATTGYSHHILPVPAVYVVAAGGEIIFQHANPHYRVRLNIDVLLAVLEATK